MAKSKKKPAAKKPANKKPGVKKPAVKKPAKKKPAKKATKPTAKKATKPVANKPTKKAKPVAKKPAANKKPAELLGINPMSGEKIVDATGQRSKEPDVTAKPPDGDLLRGTALVDAALAIRGQTETLEGMSPDEIAAIDLGGKPLSPALAHWLARDREMFTLASPISLAEMLENEVGEFAAAFVDLGKYLTEPVVVFDGWGADSRRFIYLGATDAHGEYPVFTIDIDDTPFACLNGPVDVWLAQHAGALPDEQFYGSLPAAYEPARGALATACFGGNLSFVDGQFWKTLEG